MRYTMAMHGRTALVLMSLAVTPSAAASVDQVIRDPRMPVAPILLEAIRAAAHEDGAVAVVSSVNTANPAYPRLTRVGDQLVRADNLTGTSGRAARWVPVGPE